MGGNNPPKNAPKFKEKQTLQTQTLSCFHINHHGNVFFCFCFLIWLSFSCGLQRMWLSLCTHLLPWFCIFSPGTTNLQSTNRKLCHRAEMQFSSWQQYLSRGFPHVICVVDREPLPVSLSSKCRLKVLGPVLPAALAWKIKLLRERANPFPISI